VDSFPDTDKPTNWFHKRSSISNFGRNNQYDSPTKRQYQFLPVEHHTQSIDKNDSELSLHSGSYTSNISSLPSLSPSAPTHNNNVGNLLRIQIETSQENPSVFFVPISVMLQREIEMQEAARINRIGQDRWSTSRIFRMWRRQQQQQQQHHHNHHPQQERRHHSSSASDMTIRLTPEISLQHSKNCYSDFHWKTWLTTCIRAYYNTGCLRIPQSCQGDDILLALEYFGILTASTDMFMFESDLAFQRIQAWSRYYTYRTELAETILEAFDDIEKVQQRIDVGEENEDDEIDHDRAKALFLQSSPFTTLLWVLEDEQKGHFPVNKSSCHVGGIAAKPLTVRAEGGLYQLFYGGQTDMTSSTFRHDDDEDYQLTRNLPCRLRLNFCDYVRQSILPGATVSFNLEQVEFFPSPTDPRARNSTFAVKPVIRIEPDRCKDTSPVRGVKQIDANVENPGSSFPSTSTWHRAVTVSSTGRNDPWKVSQSSTERSPITETLARKGISPTQGDVHASPSPFVPKNLFSHDSYLDTNQNMSFRIHMKSDVNSKTRCPPMYRQDFEMTDVNIKTSRPQDVEMNNAQVEAVQELAPINYVNTQFGDLRSVTSMLSEPVVDTPGIDLRGKTTNCSIISGADRDTHAIEEKKLLTETAKNIIRARVFFEEGTVENPTSEAYQYNESQPRDLRHTDDNVYSPPRRAGIPPNWPESLESAEELGIIPKDGAKDIVQEHRTDKKIIVSHQISLEPTEAGPPTKTPLDTWGNLLASVCEAVIPVRPSNNSSSSPTRAFRVCVTESRSHQQDCDLPGEKDVAQPSAGCPCRQGTGVVHVEGGPSQWVPTDTFPNEKKEEARKTTTSDLTNDQFLRQMGREISTQFDALIKVAFEASEIAANGFLPTIPEETPGTILPQIEEKRMKIATRKSQVSFDAYQKPMRHTSEESSFNAAFIPLQSQQSHWKRSKLPVGRRTLSPTRASYRSSDSDVFDVQPRSSHLNPTTFRDRSVSSLSELSSARLPRQTKDCRKMLM
jgi:hypothetical protein